MTQTPAEMVAEATRLEAQARDLRQQAAAAEREQGRARMELIVPPVDRAAVTLTDGAPVPADHSHTEDRGDGQQKGYIVLSEEERAKGFVRPVRDSYVHVGVRPEFDTRPLSEEEKARYASVGYVAFEPYPPGHHGSATGRYWTEAKLKSGCRQTTTMSRSLAETYARDPSFYSGTFCVGCGKHFPVGARGEFVWTGTEERVGT